MNVAIYAPSTNIYSKILNRNLGELNPELGVEIHRSICSLKQRLCQPVNELLAAVLYVAGEDELTEFLRMQDLFWDLPVILIVSSLDRKTFTRAHILRPRFLTDVDDDFKDVAGVLQRLLDKKAARPDFQIKADRPETAKRTGWQEQVLATREPANKRH